MNNNNNVKKSILLSLAIIMFGVLVAGGTYAYFTVAFDATNSNIVTSTTCFSVNYTDNTDQITGTLFPSAGPAKGLVGSITYQANQTCGVNGRGTFKLIVANGTSNVLTAPVAPHCENKYTLETVKDYNYFDCTNDQDNLVWVTNGTALKYAIFDSSQRTHIYKAGYIDDTFIGTEKIIHSDFSVNATSKSYYLYIWLDGHTTDNTYTNLPFSATSRLEVAQVGSGPITYTGDVYTTVDSTIYTYGPSIYSSFGFDATNYQRINYIQSTGTQYIDTEVTPTATTDIEVTFTNDDTNVNYQRVFGQPQAAGNTRFQMQMNNANSTSWLMGMAGSNTTITVDATTSYKTVKVVSGTGIFVDGTQVATVTSTETNSYNIYLFRGYDKYSSLKMSRAIIWQDGVIVRYLEPCVRNSDGVAGMFDSANGIFYPNANTTGNDFTTPPAV